MLKPILICVTLMATTLLVGCSGGDDQATPKPGGGTPTAVRTAPATTPSRSIVPPYEGPPRIVVTDKKTNYRDLPEFRLPQAAELPEPPADATGVQFHPPEPPCPPAWQKLQRPVEGFQICYPDTWVIDGHGYVSAAFDDRWYSIGFFLFDGDRQLAHVGVYVMDAKTQPFTYTRDCQQAYRVTFSGLPAVFCPDLPGVSPEAKIMTYQIRRDDLDYYVNIVPYFKYDNDKRDYLTTWPDEIEQQGIAIAQTVKFIPIQTPPG